MAKPNKRHNEKCKAYKTRGQREINKALKQARHEARLTKEREKRDAGGRCYHYEPNPYDPETQPKLFLTEQERRAEKTKSPLCEYQRLARVFGRLHRNIMKQEEEWKKEQIKARKKKVKPPEEVIPAP